MALYTPVVGIITNIEYMTDNNGSTDSCTLLITMEGENPAGPLQIQLPANAYILNLHPFQIGDRATFFYATDAPMVLIYPPCYTAIAGAYTPHGTTAMLDVFQKNPEGVMEHHAENNMENPIGNTLGINMENSVINTDNTLALNLAWNTPVTLLNGQPFKGGLADKLLLVSYSFTTRSIPPQTTPEQIVVFCQSN